MKSKSDLVPDFIDVQVEGEHDTMVLPSFVDLKRKTLEALYGLDRNMKYNHALLMDKSPKGSVDEGIRSLVDLINAHPSFSTLSSCSGRISLFDPNHAATSVISKDDELVDQYMDSSTGKGHGAWIISSHAKISFQNLKASLDEHSRNSNSNHALLFKHEPLLLHVAASNMNRARQLFTIALNLGFRESGLVVTHKRITVAIRSHSLVLNLPIASSGGLRPPDAYLEALVDIANERFDANAEKLIRLEQSIEETLFKSKSQHNQNESITIQSILLPELKLWNHSAVVSSQSNNHSDEILVIGGHGSGPNNHSKVTRSDKIYSLSCSLDISENMRWKELNQNIVHIDNIAGFSVKPATFTPREGHASCTLNLSDDQDNEIHAIFGGRTGPSNPISDLLFMIHSKIDGSVAFFSPSNVKGECPPRWGHTFTALSGKHGANLAIIVGGKDDHEIKSNVYLLSFTYNAEGRRYLEWRELAISIPRFHHCASLISPSEDIVLISDGLISTAIVPTIQDEKLIPTIALNINADGIQQIDVASSLVRTFGSSLSSFTLGNSTFILKAGGLPSDDLVRSVPMAALNIAQVVQLDTVSLKHVQCNVPINIDLGSSVHSACLTLKQDHNPALVILGGGVPTFAFGQSYANSYWLRIHRTEIYDATTFDANVPKVQEITSVKPHKGSIDSNSLVEISVLFVLKRNAKELKNILEKYNFLDKKYRMVPAHVSAPVNDPKSCIAVPISRTCSEEWRRVKDESLDSDIHSSWSSLVLNEGTQPMPYSSSMLGNQKKR